MTLEGVLVSHVLEPTLLSDAQKAALPTEDDVRFYEEHGWFVTPRVFTDDLLDEVMDGVDRFYRGERDAELPRGAAFSDWSPGDDGPVRVNMHVAYRSAAMRRLILQPVLGAIAARLARTREVRLFEDELIYKAPVRGGGTGATGWHTDYSYTSTCSSAETLTAWTPLHGVPRERGPLTVLDGSHRWPRTEHLRLFHEPDLHGVAQRFAAEGHEVTEVPLVLEKGQVSFHHSSTVHGSHPNRSDEPRIALAAHLQDADNHYREYWNGEKRIHHALDSVCRSGPDGDPDYADPEFFPVVWTEPVP